MLRRGLLLDRDGVINLDKDFVSSREQFEFLPKLFPFLRRAQDLGFRLAILTNQSGVARGLYTTKDYDQLTGWLLAALAKEAIVIDLVLACFEYSEGKVTQYRRESFWRKPSPGMVLEAAQRMRLDLQQSVFLGDSLRDMQAAQAAAIKTPLWLTEKPHDVPRGVKVVKNFDEALKVMQS